MWKLLFIPLILASCVMPILASEPEVVTISIPSSQLSRVQELCSRVDIERTSPPSVGIGYMAPPRGAALKRCVTKFLVDALGRRNRELAQQEESSATREKTSKFEQDILKANER